jgi:hypothetical protein
MMVQDKKLTDADLKQLVFAKNNYYCSATRSSNSEILS